MHNAPVVYVPTQPEGNGLTLPMLLSLLAHGLVIGVLIYTYQHTEVEPTGSIETVMVSPEQLAEMQGQILANRAAAASAMQAESTTGTMQTENFDSSASMQDPSQPNSQRVPVFTRSDDASQPMLMSEDQRQRIIDQNQDYERRMAEWAAQLDESVTEEHNQIERDKREQRIEEQTRTEDYRNKQNMPPKVNRPNPNDRNIDISAGSSGRAGQNYSLSKDGESTVSESTSNQASNRGGGSRSMGDVKSAIADKIERNLSAPTETQGLTARVRLKLDSRGNVLSANASGSNPKVNKAAEDAAFAASPLPIDFDNAANFADLIINVTVQ